MIVPMIGSCSSLANSALRTRARIAVRQSPGVRLEQRAEVVGAAHGPQRLDARDGIDEPRPHAADLATMYPVGLPLC